MVKDDDCFLSALTICCVTVLVLSLAGCTKKSSAQTAAPDLKSSVKVPFKFVAYGDTRFHNPKDFDASNPPVRIALVEAIDATNPAFICITGDLVYNGSDLDDWGVWDRETSVWHEKSIPVYPSIGNHELHGGNAALVNYFQRFPELKYSRYYSVRAANTLLLVLDSDLNETSGPQGEWLVSKLDHVPADVDFVFLIFHHPPYTSSSGEKMFGGGGHSARTQEIALAKMLEERQSKVPFRIVVINGHVHNYERHEHGGVTYFVSGGGGAHAYPIERARDDPYQSKEINYHYLLVQVDYRQLTITMNRLDMSTGKPVWTQPDSVKIMAPVPAAQAAGR